MQWPWKTILVWAAVALGPSAVYFAYSATHNFGPLTMPIPLGAGEYRSGIFKTNVDGCYELEFELTDPHGRYTALNGDAVLDLAWEIVDTNGTVVAHGDQNMQLGPLHGFTLIRYTPVRGVPQRLIVDLHRNIVEPSGSHMVLYVNSTEDSDGIAIGLVFSFWWAVIVGGVGTLILLVLSVQRARRRATPETASRIQ